MAGGPSRLGLGLLFGMAAWGVAQAQTAGPFDGQYVGELALTSVVTGDCAEPAPGALYPMNVSRGVVRFKYTPRSRTTLTGTVNPDGSFEATGRLRRGVVRMTGRIDGDTVTAEIHSPSCNYSYRTGQ